MGDIFHISCLIRSFRRQKVGIAIDFTNRFLFTSELQKIWTKEFDLILFVSAKSITRLYNCYPWEDHRAPENRN